MAEEEGGDYETDGVDAILSQSVSMYCGHGAGLTHGGVLHEYTIRCCHADSQHQLTKATLSPASRLL